MPSCSPHPKNLSTLGHRQGIIPDHGKGGSAFSPERWAVFCIVKVRKLAWEEAQRVFLKLFHLH